MLDSIVNYIFAEQTKRMDKLEIKINELQKRMDRIINAICLEKGTEQKPVLGCEQRNGEETQHRPVTQTESRSANEGALRS